MLIGEAIRNIIQMRVSDNLEKAIQKSENYISMFTCHVNYGRRQNMAWICQISGSRLINLRADMTNTFLILINLIRINEIRKLLYNYLILAGEFAHNDRNELAIVLTNYYLNF